MVYDLGALQRILNQLAASNGRISQRESARLAEQIKDFRLEHNRLGILSVSPEQLHCIDHLEGRLSMLATGYGSTDGIAPAVERTLEAFGWTK
jgi:hypothetical protein